jgi:hypothetical protein
MGCICEKQLSGDILGFGNTEKGGQGYYKVLDDHVISRVLAILICRTVEQ